MSISTLLNRAEDAIESAQLLLDKSFYEASVSRAYYAMFYAAEALLLSKGLFVSTHKGVITLLNEHLSNQVSCLTSMEDDQPGCRKASARGLRRRFCHF